MDQIRTQIDRNEVIRDIIRGNYKKIDDRESEIYLVELMADFIKDLHKKKSKTYGNSWKKRGWPGIFSNVARKFDRVEKIFNTPDLFVKFVEKPIRNNTEEQVLDTLLDGAVYNILAFTEFVRQHPDIFIDWIKNQGLISDEDIALIEKSAKDFVPNK